MNHLSGVTFFLMIGILLTLNIRKGYGASLPSIPDDFVDVQAELESIIMKEWQKQIEDEQYRAETSALMQHVKDLQEEMEKIPSLSESTAQILTGISLDINSISHSRIPFNL